MESFRKSLISSMESPIFLASLISSNHSVSRSFSVVNADTINPPKMITILGNSAILVYNLRPVALRPNLSRGLPLSFKVLKY